MDTIDIPKAVKEAVQRVDPTATVILYGSRARGDARPDSDWDFLVVHQGSFDSADETRCRRKVFHEVELEHDVIVSLLHRSKAQLQSDLYQAMPIHQNINREGVLL